MPLSDLNHFFVRANDLEATRDFYVNVLGFEVMPRPNFPFPGYWLGVGGKVQVHMGPHGIPNSDLYYLGTPRDASTTQSGVVDHVAFAATGSAAFMQRFRELGIAFRPRHLPGSNLYQIFLRDPNGLMIELNFSDIGDAPDWPTL
jgi:catechol 2,3-dioxygenase-like lactoylglutathione lyase family enzyme